MLLKTNSFIAWRNNWRTHCPSMKSLMGFNCSLSVCVCEWPLCSKLFHSLILSHLAIRSVWFSQRNKWQQLKANFVPLQSFEHTKSSEQKKKICTCYRTNGVYGDRLEEKRMGRRTEEKTHQLNNRREKNGWSSRFLPTEHIGYIEHIAVSQPSSARDT